MKRLSVLFVFALIASMAAIGVADAKTKNFRADLTPNSEVGVTAADTNATGGATFQASGPNFSGAGTGGMESPASAPESATAGRDRYKDILRSGIDKGGAAGAGATQTESYEGIVDNPRELSKAYEGRTAGRDVVHYQVAVDNINDVTAAHLHLGKPGTTEGPVIAPLYLGPGKSGPYSGQLISGTITAKDLTGPMSGKSIDDLVREMNAGNVYVNVHTVQNPAGEIRGEVKPG